MTDWVFGAELLAGTGALEAGAGLVREEGAGAACGILAVGFAPDLAGGAALEAAAGVALDVAGAGGAALDAAAGGGVLDPAGAGTAVPDDAAAGGGAFGTVLEIVVITGCVQSPVML